MSLKTYDSSGREKSSLLQSPDRTLITGGLTPLLTETFAEASSGYPNINRWMGDRIGTYYVYLQPNTGFILLNEAGAAVANNGIRLRSARRFAWFMGAGLVMRWRMKFPVAAQANASLEAGLTNTGGATTAPLDGAFFRWGSDGTFKVVMTQNAVETLSPALASPAVNTVHDYAIIYRPSGVRFLIDDGAALQYDMSIPAGGAQPTAAQSLAASFCVRTGAVAPAAAPQLYVGDVMVGTLDSQVSRQWPDAMASSSRHAIAAPANPYATSANWVNSTAPAAATLSNSVPSYATLGGLFNFNVPAGANTDYALFGYLVPAGKTLFITDIAISSSVLTVLGANGATLWWLVGVGSTAANLATADSLGVAIRGPRVQGLGIQAYPTTTAVGTAAESISRAFRTPLLVQPTTYLHIILRVPLGTASGAIQGLVAINGWFE